MKDRCGEEACGTHTAGPLGALPHSQVTDNGLVPLLACVPNLTNLNITGVGVTDAVIRALQTHCPRLQSLHAKGCDYGLPGGAHMKPPTTASAKRTVSVSQYAPSLQTPVSPHRPYVPRPNCPLMQLPVFACASARAP